MVVPPGRLPLSPLRHLCPPGRGPTAARTQASVLGQSEHSCDVDWFASPLGPCVLICQVGTMTAAPRREKQGLNMRPVQTAPLSSPVALSRLLNAFEPQFPCL